MLTSRKNIPWRIIVLKRSLGKVHCLQANVRLKRWRELCYIKFIQKNTLSATKKWEYKLKVLHAWRSYNGESTPVFQQMMQHGGRNLIFEAFELGLKWIPGYRYTTIKCDSLEVERPVMAASSLISEKLAPIMASLTARRSNVERYNTASQWFLVVNFKNVRSWKLS